METVVVCVWAGGGVVRLRRSIPVLMLLLLGASAFVRAAAADGVIDPRLRLVVTPQFGVFRGQAPLPLTASLSWSNPSLLEGRLQLQWYVNRTLLGTYLSPELALSESSVTRTVLLPPIIMPRDDAVCSVHGQFITSRRVYDLDTHDLSVPLDWRRTLVVGLCREPPLQMETETIGADDPAHVSLIESLRFEAFIDQHLSHRELSTMVVEVNPAEAPTNPLLLLGLDMLVIPGESFDKLRPRCLDALATWVEAGGSLCCLVDAPLPQSHVEFLNRLAASPDDAPYLRTRGGQLLPVQGDPQGIDPFRSGLGRLVVVRGKVEYGSEDWRRALLFLWKVRQDRVADWQRRTPWPLEMTRSPDMYLPFLTLEPERRWSATAMEDLLLPDTVKGLPLWAVCGILVLFLLVIAPGDYLLLGWLRRRRWTWVLFPAMSLLFTGVMMRLAESHLGRENVGRSITIVDLSRDGRPLRTTRIDLLYSAARRRDEAEQNGTLMVPIDPETSGTGASRDSTPSVPRYDEPWVYAGSLPGRHVVYRDVQQWSPRLSRTTTLGPGIAPGEPADDGPRAAETLLAGFDWRSITWERIARSEDRDALQSALQSWDDSAGLLVLGGGRRWEPSSGPSSAQDNAERSGVEMFVVDCSRPPGNRLFALVSSISPTAGGSLDDLAMLDPSDPSERLVMVLTEPDEGQYVVYRLLLTNE